MMASARISIIVPCYSLERLGDIYELLDSVNAQTYHNIETLVVAERSPELASNISSYVKEKGYGNIKAIYNEGDWGSYSARNLGIEQAQGDVLAFIDDDALLFPDWAEETARSYAEDDSVIGLTGPILPLWQDSSMSWFPRELYWIFSCTYWDWTEKREVRNGYGTNISFLRQAFDAYGLFKNSLETGERGGSDWQRPGAKETEFSVRVTQKTGKRIVYNPNIRVKHKVYRYRLSTGFIAKRSYWEGYAKAWLKRWSRSSNSKVLATEYELLRRIFLNLLPGSLVLLLRQPIVALRRLWVTALVLSCVSVGYTGYNLSRFFSRGRN
jgi:glycosyltransferase involved in cell wall biosynthesis